MKFEIKHRFFRAVLFSTEAESMKLAVEAAVKSRVDLIGANLSEAYLSYAYLSYANLIGADLSDANMSGANLSRANLSRANLIGANLRRVDLIGANLTGAKFTGVPIIEHLDSRILATIEAGGKLNMGEWHSCGTTHCRGGWAISLAGQAGAELEQKIGIANAATLIYLASTGRVPDFYCDNDTAMADIRTGAAKENGNA
ncbi:MAG TPA: pentapeptide repeat-containing protein [Rhodanobacter sp.]|nr:pentapeptide repeat-containing protein [Rhodanobacter sp.]